MDRKTARILWFEQLGIEDVPLVGGKNASLGEMYKHLTPKGVSIPNGFAITATAYRHFIESAGLKHKIEAELKDLNIKDIEQLQLKGKRARDIIRQAEFPEDLKSEIRGAYALLCKQYNANTDVAVRSSATAEDLPDASFAGQQETFLNIRGEHELLEACKKCFASLFTNRAIVYRADKGFSQFSVYLSIGVQKMVRSDKACSGVMFSIDTESGFKDVVEISAAYGLGENVVQGAVNPDEYVVFKPTLAKGFNPILSKTVGEKSIKMIYTHDGSRPTKNIEVNAHEREKYALKDSEILTLAKWAIIIEDHYSKKAGKFRPMDMEWAKDGITGKLFIVQARPETVQSTKDKRFLEKYSMTKKGKLIVSGSAIGEKIGQGPTRVIKDVKDMKKFIKGEVLVTDMTDPDWVPIMKIASAIVTNRGGRSCHAAIVSRELGVPCVVGTNNGTELIKSGQKVTVSCAEGGAGNVYEGIVPFEIKKIDLKSIPKTKTKIMLNVGEPRQAFQLSMLPNEGVGLAREEFIINNYIGVHPMALLHFDKVTDAHARKEIIKRTSGYKIKADFYVDKLAEGIAMIGAAFYPKDVILRLSDFKTNEYAGLIGGTVFEPKEDNPMIGWRGASRYYDPNFRDAFALECKAILRVRKQMGLTNVKVMIPMCRTIDEAQKVMKEMQKSGLKQHDEGLEVYVMCEVPANVILAEQFADVFDGFSIGSNDLTQFTLAVDRDSQLVSRIFDERNEAVKSLVAKVIAAAKKKGKKIGICGQAPSDYPEFAEFLVECGIDSISLNPDVAIKTLLAIHAKELKLAGKGK
ncbi:MAG: phosphoenolpyruvate synthase [Nanoarchaeota archaeon]